MRDLRSRNQPRALPALAQPVAQLDILDRGPPVGGGVESAQGQERLAADRAAAGPEGRGLRLRALVDEVVREANNNPYGLAAAVWTRDIAKAHRVARKLQAGTVWINTYNNFDPAAAFGGYKMSGYGRELGMHALEHYTQVKSVWVNLV